MDVCEVIDGTSTVVMEDGVNKIFDETHRECFEHDKETNPYAMKMVIEECPDDTSPVDMWEGANYRNDNKNEKSDAEKEVYLPDETSPVEMEEGVNDENIEKNYEEKEAECLYDTSPVEIKEGVNDENIKKTMGKKRQNA